MGERNPDDEVLLTKLGTLTQLPKQKFSYPMTAAQEIGWDMDTEYRNHVPKDAKNKNMCPETKYADNFVTFQGRSPFAQIKPTAAASGAPAAKK